jgi:hypothetical protein
MLFQRIISATTSDLVPTRGTFLLDGERVVDALCVEDVHALDRLDVALLHTERLEADDALVFGGDRFRGTGDNVIPVREVDDGRHECTGEGVMKV